MQQKVFLLLGEHCSRFEITSKKVLCDLPLHGMGEVLSSVSFSQRNFPTRYLTQWVDQVDGMVAQRWSYHQRL